MTGLQDADEDFKAWNGKKPIWQPYGGGCDLRLITKPSHCPPKRETWDLSIFPTRITGQRMKLKLQDPSPT